MAIVSLKSKLNTEIDLSIYDSAISSAPCGNAEMTVFICVGLLYSDTFYNTTCEIELACVPLFLNYVMIRCAYL